MRTDHRVATSAKVRRFRRSRMTPWGSGCRTASYPRTTWHPVMGQVLWSASWTPMAGCASTPAACNTRILSRPGTAWRSGRGTWHGLPYPALKCPRAGCRRLASVWRGLGRASCAASPASPSTKRLRFGRHRVAALPHHCRPQGVPRPPCPAPGDRTRGKAPAPGRRTPRAAGARAMSHTSIETPHRKRCPMSAEQRTKLSLAQHAYVTRNTYSYWCVR
jgi:hypothetical protein